MWPRHVPSRTARRERAHPVEHVVHLSHDVLPVDDERARAGQAERDVERGSVLGDVDVLAAEHRVAALGDAALVGERKQKRDRLLGDAVLREVGVDPGGLERQPFDAPGVAREELAQVKAADGLVVPVERLPGGGVRERSGHVVGAAGRPRASRRLGSDSRRSDPGGAMATETPMQLGMVGLGRMGANLVRRLMRDGHTCVGSDVSADAVAALAAEGMTAAALARGARRRRSSRPAPSG